jgi:DNA-binding protein HU-beta
MNEKLTIKEMIVRIAERSGATKKLSADMLKALPGLIEQALERDGEVRIAGLGAFKLKWVKARRARNLKTGGSVEVPAHNKVVFHPEKGLKEKVNEEYKYLTYTIIEEEKPVGQLDKGEVVSRQSSVVSADGRKEKTDRSKEIHEETEREVSQASEPSAAPIPEPQPPEPREPETEESKVPEYRKRKLIWWIIPLIFIIIALLIVIFYMRNCQDELTFSKDNEQEQVIKPAGPTPGDEEPAIPDSSAMPVQDDVSEELTPTDTAEEIPEPEPKGFEEQSYVITKDKYLFQIARETYGNPFLWVLIYKENQSRIADPEILTNGTELVIPALEGTPDNLASSDSTRIAEGYRMLYEYYSSKGDDRAGDFRYAMNVFTPR